MRKILLEFISSISIPTVLRDDDGSLRGFGTVTRDLAERRKAEEQRLQIAREQVARAEADAASRAKDEFLATISHKLRPPLNSILGWARMIRGRSWMKRILLAG